MYFWQRKPFPSPVLQSTWQDGGPGEGGGNQFGSGTIIHCRNSLPRSRANQSPHRTTHCHLGSKDGRPPPPRCWVGTARYTPYHANGEWWVEKKMKHWDRLFFCVIENEEIRFENLNPTMIGL
ncbi:hypothetical protein CDAR_290001 [Caerostris darwini]|uniref:Uncharacterized protein n=1 Tax=Caerostris darwini TaxID=1538125 RepID=A0AAV4WYD1_9ARAC|nr:hypothetical protein CDAR_290001 [Caerostris darwini]